MQDRGRDHASSDLRTYVRTLGNLSPSASPLDHAAMSRCLAVRSTRPGGRRLTPPSRPPGAASGQLAGGPSAFRVRHRDQHHGTTDDEVPGHRLAQHDDADQHREQRHDVVDGRGRGGADVGDQPEVEDVGEAGAQDAEERDASRLSPAVRCGVCQARNGVTSDLQRGRRHQLTRPPATSAPVPAATGTCVRRRSRPRNSAPRAKQAIRPPMEPPPVAHGPTISTTPAKPPIMPAVLRG